MKSVQKIWAELSAKAQEVELSEEQKVELSTLSKLEDLARDIVRLNNVVLGHNTDMRNKSQELQSSVSATEGAISDWSKMKNDVQTAAKEFGVDISGDIKQAESFVREAEQTIKDMKKRWGVK